MVIGTWSKTSQLITGRRPFARDTTLLDYEVDSEAEWEADEEGEECRSDEEDEEEEDVRGDEEVSVYIYTCRLSLTLF
jgi:hypothetical protein